MTKLPPHSIGALAITAGLVLAPLYFAFPLIASAFDARQVPIRTEATGSECGNGVIEPSEICDDGNRFILDGCTGCLVERGYRCAGEPSMCLRQFSGAACGNGIISRSEQCDDGNVRDDDGCSRLCLREEGFKCSGAPSVCTR